MNEYKRLSYYLDKKCTMLAMPQRKERINLYVERLAELEDKIERGELIFTMQNEQGNKEIDFFVKHNAKVRKETAREILKTIRDISICPVTTGYVVIDGADWLELFQKYGVEVEE